MGTLTEENLGWFIRDCREADGSVTTRQYASLRHVSESDIPGMVTIPVAGGKSAVVPAASCFSDRQACEAAIREKR